MKMKNLKIQKVKNLLKKNQPSILIGIGIAGFIGAVVMSVKATTKASELLNEKKVEEETENFTKKEIVKTTWKCYAPVIVLGAVSTICILSANKISSKRNAVLAAAFSMSESAFSTYKNSVLEVVDAETNKKINEQVAKKQVSKYSSNYDGVINTGKGEDVCLDPYSGRHFYSSIDKIKSVINELNSQLVEGNDIYLNDLYYELGLSGTDFGASFLWEINKTKLIRVDFNSVIMDNKKPCIVINYTNPPFHERHYYS